MASRAETIAARVAAVLADAGTVYRDREDAITREESPTTLVELIDEDSTVFGGGRPALAGETDQDTLRLGVIVCVRGAAWQSAADARRVANHALIVGDATLRGLVASMRRDRCEWRPAKADQPFGYAAQIYYFKYLTRAHALDQSP